MRVKPMDVVVYILIAVALFLTLFPIYWTFKTAFQNSIDAFHIPPLLLPSANGVRNFMDFVQKGGLGTIRNSLIVGISSTIIIAIIGPMAGYSFSRFKVGGNFLPFWILSQRMLPPIAFVIPIFLIFQSLNLVNTYPGLTLAYIAFNLPYAVWMMRGIFDELPVEIEEAAMIDGCSNFQRYWKIALPLARPGIAATFIFCFILAWNEFLFALILMRSRNMFTLPVTEYSFYFGGGSGFMFGPASMQAIIAIVPVIILSIYIQKHLVRGLTFGAVKG
ncbi:MAG: carbohydrate ABC transporter permease [Candidatus Bathyarchaeia archaeon]